VGPLFVSRLHPPKKPVFSVFGNHDLVEPRVADALRAIGVDCLEEVREAKSCQQLPYFELRPTVVLPRFSDKSLGIVREDPCPLCNRDGYFAIPYITYALAYERKDLPFFSRKKVMATFEWFGNSKLREPFKDSVFAAPLIIINEEVYRVLYNIPVTAIEYNPVLIC